MDGNINQTIRKLEDTIIKILNVTDLPIEVKRLILSDIYHEVVKQADTEIIQMFTEEKDNAEST